MSRELKFSNAVGVLSMIRTTNKSYISYWKHINNSRYDYTFPSLFRNINIRVS